MLCGPGSLEKADKKNLLNDHKNGEEIAVFPKVG